MPYMPLHVLKGLRRGNLRLGGLLFALQRSHCTPALAALALVKSGRL